MAKKEVTLQHIADEVHVSVQTVSKALRGKPGMSEATRQRIFQVAKALNYFTKSQEQSLASEQIPVFPGRQRRFVFLTPSATMFDHSPHLEILIGLQNKLNEFKHMIETIPLSSDISIKDFDDWLEMRGVPYADGLFISYRVPERLQEKLLTLPLPKVLINFPPANAKVDSVIWDVHQAVHWAVDSLWSYGHRKILYIGSNEEGVRGYRLRWYAFQEASELIMGHKTDESEHMLTEKLSREQFVQLLGERLETIQPTAMLNAVDVFLPYIEYAAHQLGKQIPEDYSLVSLETVRSSFNERVTSPIMHLRETGTRAADRMLWRIANPHLPHEHIRISVDWHTGNTIKKLSQEA